MSSYGNFEYRSTYLRVKDGVCVGVEKDDVGVDGDDDGDDDGNDDDGNGDGENCALQLIRKAANDGSWKIIRMMMMMR